jgi:hypothetical protein
MHVNWHNTIPGCFGTILMIAMLPSCHTVRIASDNAPFVSQVKSGSPLSTIRYGLVYDTHIRIRKNEMSGLMYLRQVSEDVWRIALTAKVGQTLFDFELRPDTFIVHKCIEQLKRKIVLTYLERDLRLLTERYPNPDEIALLDAPEGYNHVRFKTPGRKGWRHLTMENVTGRVIGVAWGSKSSAKTQVLFTTFTDHVPEVIAIDHRTIFNFEIQMHQVHSIRK